jgi:hypothetical protein
MRHGSEVLILIMFVLIASPAPADDAAREIIERAMKARSEKTDLLEKQRCGIIAMQGKMYMADQKGATELPATGEMQMEWPSSFRWNREILMDGAKKQLPTLCVRADAGWLEGPNHSVTEMSFIQLEETKMEMYGRWLTTLYPLKDKAFNFKLLKESRVGDEDVEVVKVMAKLRPDVYMYFSKKNAQLLKAAYKAREQGAEVRKEHLFSDYKTFDGLLLPAKMIDTMQFGDQSPSKSAEWTVTGYKFVEKLGDDVFTMPKMK